MEWSTRILGSFWSHDMGGLPPYSVAGALGNRIAPLYMEPASASISQPFVNSSFGIFGSAGNPFSDSLSPPPQMMASGSTHGSVVSPLRASSTTSSASSTANNIDFYRSFAASALVDEKYLFVFGGLVKNRRKNSSNTPAGAAAAETLRSSVLSPSSASSAYSYTFSSNAPLVPTNSFFRYNVDSGEVVTLSITLSNPTATYTQVPPLSHHSMSLVYGYGSDYKNWYLYIFGGKTIDDLPSNCMYRYDLQKGSWTSVQYSSTSPCSIKPITGLEGDEYNFTDIPSPRYSHACAVIDSTKIYLFGGETTVLDPCRPSAVLSSPVYLNDLYIFDTSNNQWIRVKQDYDSSQQKDCDDEYLDSTQSESGSSRKGSKYRSSNKAKPKAVIPPPRSGHSWTLYGIDVYLFGGGNNETMFNDMYCLNIDSLVWRKIEVNSENPAHYSSSKGKKASSSKLRISTAVEPTKRMFHTAAVIGDQLIIFGGMGARKDITNDGEGELMVFDLYTRVWNSTVLKLPTSKLNSAKSTGSNKSGRGAGPTTPDVFRPPCLYGHTCSVSGSKLWVFGGYFVGSTTNVLETPFSALGSHPFGSFGDAGPASAYSHSSQGSFEEPLFAMDGEHDSFTVVSSSSKRSKQRGSTASENDGTDYFSSGRYIYSLDTNIYVTKPIIVQRSNLPTDIGLLLEYNAATEQEEEPTPEELLLANNGYLAQDIEYIFGNAHKESAGDDAYFLGGAGELQLAVHDDGQMEDQDEEEDDEYPHEYEIWSSGLEFKCHDTFCVTKGKNPLSPREDTLGGVGEFIPPVDAESSQVDEEDFIEPLAYVQCYNEPPPPSFGQLLSDLAFRALVNTDAGSSTQRLHDQFFYSHLAVLKARCLTLYNEVIDQLYKNDAYIEMIDDVPTMTVDGFSYQLSSNPKFVVNLDTVLKALRSKSRLGKHHAQHSRSDSGNRPYYHVGQSTGVKTRQYAQLEEYERNHGGEALLKTVISSLLEFIYTDCVQDLQILTLYEASQLSYVSYLLNLDRLYIMCHVHNTMLAHSGLEVPQGGSLISLNLSVPPPTLFTDMQRMWLDVLRKSREATLDSSSSRPISVQGLQQHNGGESGLSRALREADEMATSSTDVDSARSHSHSSPSECDEDDQYSTSESGGETHVSTRSETSALSSSTSSEGHRYGHYGPLLSHYNCLSSEEESNSENELRVNQDLFATTAQQGISAGDDIVQEPPAAMLAKSIAREHCDVMFIAEHEKIFAHSSILSCRSSYLRDLLVQFDAGVANSLAASAYRNNNEELSAESSEMQQDKYHDPLESGHLPDSIVEEEEDDDAFIDEDDGPILTSEYVAPCTQEFRIYNPRRKLPLREIIIEGMRPQVFKLMLEFIYTGSCEDIQFDFALELLIASEIYDLKQLSLICQYIIERKMHVHNVCRILSLASDYELEHLKESSMNFIVVHFSYIRKTIGYKVELSNELKNQLKELKRGYRKHISGGGSASKAPLDVAAAAAAAEASSKHHHSHHGHHHHHHHHHEHGHEHEHIDHAMEAAYGPTQIVQPLTAPVPILGQPRNMPLAASSSESLSSSPISTQDHFRNKFEKKYKHKEKDKRKKARTTPDVSEEKRPSKSSNTSGSAASGISESAGGRTKSKHRRTSSSDESDEEQQYRRHERTSLSGNFDLDFSKYGGSKSSPSSSRDDSKTRKSKKHKYDRPSKEQYRSSVSLHASDASIPHVDSMPRKASAQLLTEDMLSTTPQSTTESELYDLVRAHSQQHNASLSSSGGYEDEYINSDRSDIAYILSVAGEGDHAVDLAQRQEERRKQQKRKSKSKDRRDMYENSFV